MLAAAAGALCATAPVSAHAVSAELRDLSRLSLEELAELEITTVSRRPESLAGAAASAFVISQDDIRRSGAPTLPEVLRLAPNLAVQRVDALDYAISARGLNGFESANKLLVLIDGRSVYSPFFSGVEWSQHHTPLADIARIEVVSGPGGALWGANAVNGVVKVITRPAQETLGTLLNARVGSFERSLTLRHGAPLGAAGAVRVYVRGYEAVDSYLPGGSVEDGWRGGQVGFRSDFQGQASTFTLQGDAYRDDVPSQAPTRPDGKLEGSNLLARWTRTFDDGSSLQVQAYYDRYERIARGILDGVITHDIQAEYAFDRGRHRWVAGVGHRHWSDRFANFVNGFVLDPPAREFTLSNLFVQDQIELGDVAVTLGLKVEDSSFGDPEWMPSIRAAWRPSEAATFWAAASRAVRSPSRLDRDLTFRPFLERSQFEPERLIAYELGYRGRPTPRVALSATVFRHEYSGLRSTEPTPDTIFPLRIGNGLEGETWGLEAWGDFDVSPDWRLSAGFTALDGAFRRSDGSNDRSNLAAAGHDADLTGYVHSQWNLSPDIDLDVRLRFASEVPREQTGGYLDAPGYTEADARVAWRVSEQVELSIAGFNLFDAHHPEASEPRRTEVRRSVQAGLRVNW